MATRKRQTGQGIRILTLMILIGCIGGVAAVATTVSPNIIHGNYDADQGILYLAGNFWNEATGNYAGNINIAKLKVTGNSGGTYTLQGNSGNVPVITYSDPVQMGQYSGNTKAKIVLGTYDRIQVNKLWDKDGTVSLDGVTTYNLEALTGWHGTSTSGISTIGITVGGTPVEIATPAVNAEGKTNTTFEEKVGRVTINIPAGTVIKDKYNNTLTAVTVATPIDESIDDAATKLSGTFSISDDVKQAIVRLGPKGATFDPAIKVTIDLSFLSDAQWNALFAGGKTLQLQRYDEDADTWYVLTNQGSDATTKTVWGYTTSFSIFAPVTKAAGGGGNGGGTSISSTSAVVPPAPTIAGIGTVSLATDTDGALLNNYIVDTASESASLRLSAGTKAFDSAGNRLSTVGIADTPAANVPGVPAGSTFKFAGSAVTCTPAGATFNPAITLTFEMTPEQILHLEGNPDQQPVVQWYNAETGGWEALTTTYNLITGEVTVRITHFSIYGLFYQPKDIAPVQPPVTAAPTTAPATPEATPEATPFPWTYVIIGVVIIIVIAGGAYYYTRKD